MHSFAFDFWYLSGPTASGKTEVALELAQRLNAEIVSMDSMAIYRGMDIGTAKPALEQRRLTPHHLIDVVDACEDYSLAEYLAAAHAAVEQIRSRGREVLFVGGTPLYLKSLLRGVFDGPPADHDFRRDVQDEVQRVGVTALRERLRQVDPLSAAKLHPNDTRRMIRALEVYKLTGKPISHWQLQFDQVHRAEDCKVFVLTWPRPQLHERINTRVDRMFASGVVDEVRGLLMSYGELSRTAKHAVGYREILEHLQGEFDLATTVERTKARTRRFARRQETWFRGLSECRWIVRDGTHQPSQLAEKLLRLGKTTDTETHA